MTEQECSEVGDKPGGYGGLEPSNSDLRKWEVQLNQMLLIG